MPRPPAEFELLHLYKGAVQLKFYPKSHMYKVYDPEYKREWEVAPSATGLTDSMEKGAGLMVYAMSEAMKYMDRVLQNKPLKAVVDDPEFTFQQLFKDARKAHLDKSALAKRVGTASHTYVETLLKNFKKAQETNGAFSVPPVPRATDIANDLKQSWLNIIDVYTFKNLAVVEKYREVVNRDIEVRGRIWNEAQMVQRACEGAREFFVRAAKAGAVRVWAVEQIVHSREFFFTGKLDSILEFTKKFTWLDYPILPGVYITDFKTGNPSTDYPMGIYPNYLAQAGLYDVAYCEEYPEIMERIKGHLILGSSKLGEGFHPYVSLKRERNREWGKSLVAPLEFKHQAERELKGLQLYGGKK